MCSSFYPFYIKDKKLKMKVEYPKLISVHTFCVFYLFPLPYLKDIDNFVYIVQNIQHRVIFTEQICWFGIQFVNTPMIFLPKFPAIELLAVQLNKEVSIFMHKMNVIYADLA